MDNQNEIICPDCGSDRITQSRESRGAGVVEVVYECQECGAVIIER